MICILLLGKYYIYSKKVKRVCPPFRGSLLGLGVLNIELYIARKRGTLNKHLSKWEKLINIMRSHEQLNIVHKY